MDSAVLSKTKEADMGCKAFDCNFEVGDRVIVSEKALYEFVRLQATYKDREKVLTDKYFVTSVDDTHIGVRSCSSKRSLNVRKCDATKIG